MRAILFSVLLIFTSAFAFSQQDQYSTTNTDAINFYLSANKSLDNNAIDDAIDQLTQAVGADDKFVEAHAELGSLYQKKRLHKQAIGQFLKVIALNPNYNAAVYIKIGGEEIGEAQYKEAQQHLEKFLTYPDLAASSIASAQKLLKDCKFSIEAVAHPVPFKPINLGAEVNTKDDEYLPVATADESMLIFTRKINNNEDFYCSIKKDGKWQSAVPLSDVINTPQYNEGAQSISQDGRYLFFTGCNRPDGLGRCDIYVSQKKGDDWSKPFDLSPPINSPAWESQPSISADGHTLYFASNRRGGYGGYDLWKSSLTSKGWSEPENLGPNINTAYDEQSPFIHADDSTLYFSSNGWPGFGGKDLFVSRLSKDGVWGKPENLGYPINSSGDENGLSVTANGTYAFFSSDNLNGVGGFDIYTFELPKSLRPLMVTYVKGTVTDSKSRQPLDASVEIVDLEKNNVVYENDSDPAGGSFLATLTPGKNYGLNISREGYLFYSQNFSLKGREVKTPFEITVLLQQIAVGNKAILNNIFFDTNKFDLKPESISELGKLVEFLNLNPTVRIEISGHTDDVGNDQVNQALSENRAKAVYQYLITNKINANRLVYKGYGKTQPIEPNTTDENCQKNRRTEFKIIAK